MAIMGRKRMNNKKRDKKIPNVPTKVRISVVEGE
jgi:hypothetical protein